MLEKDNTVKVTVFIPGILALAVLVAGVLGIRIFFKPRLQINRFTFFNTSLGLNTAHADSPLPGFGYCLITITMRNLYAG